MRQRRGKTVAVVALAVLVVLSGCSGAASGGGDAAVSSGGATAQSVDVTREDGGAESKSVEYSDDSGGSSGGDSGDALQIQQRQIIRTGHVTLTVDNFSDTKANLTTAVESRDGFVSDSTQRRRGADGDEYVVGSVTFRVPSENFDETMERIEAAGTVQQSSTKTRDVTDQLVDIEARLENLRAERDRLRQLYQQANDTEDVLAVQRELSQTQERIERLEAQQESLQRQVAYATITVEIREERPDPGPVEQWYDVPLVKAFLDSVSGVGTTLRAIAVVVAYALPYVLTFAGPPVVFVVGYLAYRRGVFARFRPG
jgi:hypothetical protein